MGRLKSRVGWMEDVVIWLSSSHHVYFVSIVQDV